MHMHCSANVHYFGYMYIHLKKSFCSFLNQNIGIVILIYFIAVLCSWKLVLKSSICSVHISIAKVFILEWKTEQCFLFERRHFDAYCLYAKVMLAFDLPISTLKLTDVQVPEIRDTVIFTKLNMNKPVLFV